MLNVLGLVRNLRRVPGWEQDDVTVGTCRKVLRTPGSLHHQPAVLRADGRTTALGLGRDVGYGPGREQDDVVVEVCGRVVWDCSVLDDGELDSVVPE